MNVTEEIKSRLDILDIVSEYIPLRKSGTSYSGFCPFHPNTRTPAFVVFPNTQTWRCFGACAEGGDVFSFVMKKEGWEFKETLRHLADRAGVSLEEQKPANKTRQAAEERLTGLLSAAADYFHQMLLHAPQAQMARQYVSERELSQETLAKFKVGFALDSWDAGRKHFSMQGYSDEELTNTGLLTVNEEKGTSYDRFRNRLMIPIHDSGGRMVGFGARTLDPDGLPKYLNSPQTVVFDKSRLLFGLDIARRHIREMREVVIVEGYMDVMQAWQAGFHNVVAQMGTALTEAQLRLVKRYTKRFILALDADAAGAQATLRSLDVAREVLDREQDVRFDARGLVRQESRLEADIRVVTLPEGFDPDKLIRTDRDRWPELVKEAQPVIGYVINVVTAGIDVDDAKAKVAAVQTVLPIIDDIGNPVEREHYRQMLARTLQLDERVLSQVRPNRSQGRRRHRLTPELSTASGIAEEMGLETVVGAGSSVELRQADFLRQCLTFPRLISQIDEALVLRGQDPVSEDDFNAIEDRALWRQASSQLDNRAVVTIEGLCDSLEDKLLRDRVQTLLALPAIAESELDRSPDILVMSVLDWRLDQARSLIGEVNKLYQEAQTEDDSGVLDMYRQQLRDLPIRVLNINRARGAMTDVGQQTSGGAPRSHP
jgi:DNA primase